MDDENFNSSDVEFEEAPPNPFALAGKASIEAMLSNASRDRLNSKKVTRQLTYVKGSPKTQYQNSLWAGRFEAFRRNTLKTNVDAAPRGAEIERFLVSIVDHVKPKTHEVPTYSWLQHGLQRLISTSIFRFPTFTLSNHDRTRLATLIDYLYQEGKVTKDPCRERQWVGAFLVRKIGTALLEDGLKNGALSWDVVLARVAAIVLVAALCARGGDVAKDRLDTHRLPYLAYKDVTMKLVGGDKLENLVAQVKIRNEKDAKLKPDENRTVILHPLVNAGDNPICPVKIILILALRLGNVAEKSIDEVLRRTKLRKDKTIKWTHDNHPILCAFQLHGAGLVIDKPASNIRLGDIVASAGLVAGILKPIHGHDLKRGAARDVANLEAPIRGQTSQAVREALGHSSSSFKSGVTQRYVGGLSDDLWTKRVAEEYQDPHGLMIADTPFQKVKRQKLSTSRVTALCEEQGLDPKDAKSRKRAIGTAEKARIAAWRDEEQNRVAEPSDDDSEMNAENTAIDPALLAEGDNIGLILAGADEGTMTESIMNATFDQMQAGPVSHSHPDISLPPVDFVRRFSTINITRNQNLAPGVRKATTKDAINKYRGNSRDEPTLFNYLCSNATQGCTYQSSARHQVVAHEINCTEASIKAVHERQAKKGLTCPHEGCASTFETEVQLSSHHRAVHDWEVRPCTKPGCDRTTIFQTRTLFNKHVQANHSAFEPTTCAVADCLSTTLFKTTSAYRQHLKGVHKLTTEEIRQYHDLRGQSWTPTECQYPDCESEKVLKRRDHMKEHLMRVHGVLGDELNEYLYS